jgi:hypothetical protein
MALSPVLSYELQNCQQIVITNTTVWGSGIPDPARGDANVTFSAVYKPTSGDSAYELTYDPATVSTFTVALRGDGHYRFTMRIRPNEDWDGDSFDYSVELNLFVRCALRTCYLEKLTDYFRNRCKCKTQKGLELIRDIRLGWTAIDIKVEETADYTGAQCILEELLARCEKNDCGC